MISCPSSFDSRVKSAPNHESRSSSDRASEMARSNSLRFMRYARLHPVFLEQFVLSSPPTKVEANGTNTVPAWLGEGVEATVKPSDHGWRRQPRSRVEPRLASRT